MGSDIASEESAHYFHRRDWLIVKYGDRGRWRWAHNGRFLRRRSSGSDPPCRLCGLPPTPEGYDACLGEIPGAIGACCGHGVTEPYVKLPERLPESPRGRHDLVGCLWPRVAMVDPQPQLTSASVEDSPS